MIEDDLFDMIGSALTPIGCSSEPGDELREPPLEVLRYYVRPIRLSAIPILGRGVSVVAVARQPVDVAIDDYPRLVERLAKVINTRFPPIRRGRGLMLGFTAVVTTPEPIGPEDDAKLDRAMALLPRHRAVPLGLLRVNLGQEAVAFALRRGPSDSFPEPDTLADAFSLRLRRYAAFPGI